MIPMDRFTLMLYRLGWSLGTKSSWCRPRFLVKTEPGSMLASVSPTSWISMSRFLFSTKTMSDFLPLCRLNLVILPCESGRSLPSSILPCHELAGFKHYFQGETHIKQLHLHSSKTESTKSRALKCWDSFRQLPF